MSKESPGPKQTAYYDQKHTFSPIHAFKIKKRSGSKAFKKQKSSIKIAFPWALLPYQHKEIQRFVLANHLIALIFAILLEKQYGKPQISSKKNQGK
jgi:hypothetical protein